MEIKLAKGEQVDLEAAMGTKRFSEALSKLASSILNQPKPKDVKSA